MNKAEENRLTQGSIFSSCDITLYNGEGYELSVYTKHSGTQNILPIRHQFTAFQGKVLISSPDKHNQDNDKDGFLENNCPEILLYSFSIIVLFKSTHLMRKQDAASVCHCRPLYLS